MEIIIQDSTDSASIAAANLIARQVREHPKSVLGLATGGTPIRMYKELIRLHQEEGLNFSEASDLQFLDELFLNPENVKPVSKELMKPKSSRRFLFHLNSIPNEHQKRVSCGG